MNARKVSYWSGNSVTMSQRRQHVLVKKDIVGTSWLFGHDVLVLLGHDDVLLLRVLLVLLDPTHSSRFPILHSKPLMRNSSVSLHGTEDDDPGASSSTDDRVIFGADAADDLTANFASHSSHVNASDFLDAGITFFSLVNFGIENNLYALSITASVSASNAEHMAEDGVSNDPCILLAFSIISIIEDMREDGNTEDMKEVSDDSVKTNVHQLGEFLGTDAAHVNEAMDLAEKFASMKLS
ncbi:uncharacterized protein HKW66_Vig0137420 [Vigna angularis]|uniref:Uncharacterized protein n=1 Tax=Phaseolus angularis TaxID=3914 RepID=A0A8T0KGE4_PHAAN|nr:uncharacterized protein HKW66_Vig0137420 [Vigna angularis]